MTRAAAEPSTQRTTTGRDPLGIAAAVGLLSIVSLRCLVTFTPQLYWMTDPRFDRGPLTNLGPSSAAVTDVLALAVLLLTILRQMRRGGKLAGWAIALWCIGAGFAAWHGLHNFESLRIGLDWIGATALGLAALHLGTDRGLRRVLIAGVVALTVPLAAQGILQVTAEHAETIADYQHRKPQIMRQHNWAEGSTELKKFEERLFQLEATGRIGFSNIYGSLMMGLALLTAGLAAGAAGKRSFTTEITENTERKKEKGKRVQKQSAIAPSSASSLSVISVSSVVKSPAYPLAIVAVAAGAMVVLSFSKGANLALLGGAMMLVLLRWAPRRSGPVVAMMLLAMVFAAVAVRGWMGEPATPAGERSLLFRWHYWQAAFRAWLDHPFAGVGPGRFSDFYLLYKNPKNPEEILDPHSLFVAWTSMLGLGGLAWATMTLGMAWLAGRTGFTTENTESTEGVQRKDDVPKPSAPPSPSSHPSSVISVSSVVSFSGLVIALLIQFAVEFGVLGPEVALIAAVMAAPLGIAAWIGCKERKLATAWIVALATLAAGLWMLPRLGCWLASLGGGALLAAQITRREPLLESEWARRSLMLAAVLLLVHGQIEMSLTHAMSAPLGLTLLGLAAAAGLRERGRIWPAPAMAAATLIGLTVVIGLGVRLGVPLIRHQAALAHAAAAMQRGEQGDPATAAAWLREARRVQPGDPKAWADEARVAMLRGDSAAQRAEILRDAAATLDDGIRRNPGASVLWRMKTGVLEERWKLTADPADAAAAIEAATRWLQLDPHGISAHVQAADLAWNAGRRDLAQKWYAAALRLSDLAYLDPNKQLAGETLERVKSRAGKDG